MLRASSVWCYPFRSLDIVQYAYPDIALWGKDINLVASNWGDWMERKINKLRKITITGECFN